MLQAKLVLHAPAAAPSTICGSQIGLHFPEMQRSPPTQLSIPPLATVASMQGLPSAIAVAALSATHPMWPISLAVIVASTSTTHVHFSPVLQPVLATGLHTNNASMPESRSVT